MGLDSVEFVMAVEEAFQIAIPDDVAERMRTPRQVVDYVAGRVGEAQSCVCLEQRAFYKLRRATMRLFAAARTDVRPGTRWDDVLPPRQRGHNWRLLHQAVGLPHWPPLTFWGKVPAAVSTVGGTAEYLARQCTAALKGEEGWTRTHIEETISRLMKEHLGIPTFEWDQEFVRDLGVD